MSALLSGKEYRERVIDKQKQGNDSGTAKYRVQNASFALFQQAQAGILLFLFFHSAPPFFVIL